MLVIAEYCEEESQKALTTNAQYKAALKLVREAMEDMSRIDVREIEITKHKKYLSWWRVKLKDAPSVTYRAIIEIAETEVKLHVVLPRSSQTYEEVKELWEKYRTEK
jgi:hypothetical protein